MVDPNNLCMGCMRTIKAGETCPFCGFSPEEYDKKRSPGALPPFTILNGKYLVGKELGKGGFGITYLGYDLNLQLPLAIKEYFPGELATRDTSAGSVSMEVFAGQANREQYAHGLNKFRTEAQNLAKCENMKEIVSVTDFFFENETGYLVMEYVDGISLKEYLKQHGNILSERETLELMYGLIHALGRVHEMGIIHRDISPDNIMLSASGQVKLIDFGAARAATGAEAKSMTILLKHGYAPMEQYQTRGRQGPWTDVYAVCATLYRMLSGTIPETSTNRVPEDKVVPLALLTETGIHVSTAVSGAVSRGLAVWPEERYQSMDELCRDLYGESPPGERQRQNGHRQQQTAGGTERELAERQRREEKWAQEEEKRDHTRRILIVVMAVLCVIMAAAMFGAAAVLKDRQSQGDSQSDSPLETALEDSKSAVQDVLSEIGLNRKESSGEEEAVCRSVSSEVLADQAVTAAVITEIQTDPEQTAEENQPVFMFDDNFDTAYQFAEQTKFQVKFEEKVQVKYLVFRTGHWINDYTYFGFKRPKQIQLRLGDSEFEIECGDTYEEYCFEIDPSVPSEEMTLEIKETYPGKRWEDVCITDVIIYGE